MNGIRPGRPKSDLVDRGRDLTPPSRRRRFGKTDTIATRYGMTAMTDASTKTPCTVTYENVGAADDDAADPHRSVRLKRHRHFSRHGTDETVSPWEANLGWTIALDPGRDFIGRAVLEQQKAAGVKRVSVATIVSPPCGTIASVTQPIKPTGFAPQVYVL